jgi:hypothetical protein
MRLASAITSCNFRVVSRTCGCSMSSGVTSVTTGPHIDGRLYCLYVHLRFINLLVKFLQRSCILWSSMPGCLSPMSDGLF